MHQEIGWILLSIVCGAGFSNAAVTVDERPAEPGEWGFRPADGQISRVNPLGFVWRPQQNAAGYTLQVSSRADFSQINYEAINLNLFCHCPSRLLESGDWYWRFAYSTATGEQSTWSTARHFVISADSADFSMPDRDTLFSRIPTAHPRLFIRPVQLPRFRELARGELKLVYDQLVKECERIKADPPSTKEPAKYPDGMERGSDPWREIWWGNRTYTIKLLDSAATLGFTYLLDGDDQYGQLARRLLMAAAEWDPKGATGYRYNDEAGMPYNYYFSRTYTFINELLTESEKEKCRAIFKVRGEEMYDHLHPSHLWKPYGSHANRAWHFLGEIAIAFFDEIDGTRDWLWFAMNVFYNAYPVWSDDDGGWHEGLAYWRSYINRFLWWADIMRVAMDIDAYKKPFFNKVGNFPMYLQTPGAKRGGMGDLCGHLKSDGNVDLMQIFALQAQNPYWQWYVDAHGGPSDGKTYVDFIRGALPRIEAKSATHLPDSRQFSGTGLAMLHTDLTDAQKDIFIEFKSSPFGSHSHGYDAQNSFVLYAYAQPLLIRTGRRDSYGSDHHRQWMWETKSVNSILVNGEGQRPRSQAAQGEIVAFYTSKDYDYIVGEAGGAYAQQVDRFTRTILFIKPEIIVIFDQLQTPAPSTFQWLLHTPTEMKIGERQTVTVENGGAGCTVQFLAPDGLHLSQSNQFDPPPRPRIKLTQWHLTADMATPGRQCEFITVIRPYRQGDTVPIDAQVEKLAEGYVCRIALSDGEAIVLLRTTEGQTLSGFDAQSDGDVAAIRLNSSGDAVNAFGAGESQVAYRGTYVDSHHSQ